MGTETSAARMVPTTSLCLEERNESAVILTHVVQELTRLLHEAAVDGRELLLQSLRGPSREGLEHT